MHALESDFMGESQFFSRRPQLLPAIIAAALLLLGLAPWPYGYYQFLRLAVTAVAGIIAYLAFGSKHKVLGSLCVIIALLFNPVAPIHFDRDVWRAIDVGAAGVLVGLSLGFKVPLDEKDT